MDVLINKKEKIFERLSRYSSSFIYFNTNDKKWVKETDKWLADDTQYSLYEVQYGDTFDSLALKNYGNPTYYWVITSFNHIADPFKELSPGEYIKIPVITFIEYIED